VECKVAIAPLCIVTATESGVEKFWNDENETSFLKEVLDKMGDIRLMKDFVPLT
jgi:alpha-glucosidase (family GH31 glycosyl hydrolase)